MNVTVNMLYKLHSAQIEARKKSQHRYGDALNAAHCTVSFPNSYTAEAVEASEALILALWNDSGDLTDEVERIESLRFTDKWYR